MRMTSKGQVTIPKDVREKLGLGPGSNVGFREEGGQMVIEPVASDEARARAEHMIRHLAEFGRKAKRIPMTDKELMELTRGPFNDLDSD